MNCKRCATVGGLTPFWWKIANACCFNNLPRPSTFEQPTKRELYDTICQRTFAVFVVLSQADYHERDTNMGYNPVDFLEPT